MRTVRFMFAEENRGKEIKERIQKDLKQYKKAVILTGMILGTMQILFQTVCPMRILFGIPCPGCGLTHAGWYVITFQWKNYQGISLDAVVYEKKQTIYLFYKMYKR